MENNIIRFNSYKLERGGLLYDMYDQFNARVGDQGTPLVMQWTQGLADTLIDLQAKKLHFYAAGQVGQYLEKLKDGTGYQMSADASQVEYEDRNAAGTMDHGITKVKLPKQFFPQEGIFYGYFGLKDDQGNTYTSVNVWFRVLSGVPIMGAAIPYFSTRFDELMEKLNGKVVDVLAEIQKEYQEEVQKNLTVSAETRATLEKLAAAVGAVQAQIDAKDIVTRSEFKDRINDINEKQGALANSISDQLLKFDVAPKAIDSFDNLVKQYPEGATGIWICADTKHWYYWTDRWNDGGVYQGDGIAENSVNNEMVQSVNFNKIFDDLVERSKVRIWNGVSEVVPGDDYFVLTAKGGDAGAIVPFEVPITRGPVYLSISFKVLDGAGLASNIDTHTMKDGKITQTLQTLSLSTTGYSKVQVPVDYTSQTNQILVAIHGTGKVQVSVSINRTGEVQSLEQLSTKIGALSKINDDKYINIFSGALAPFNNSQISTSQNGFEVTISGTNSGVATDWFTTNKDQVLVHVTGTKGFKTVQLVLASMYVDGATHYTTLASSKEGRFDMAARFKASDYSGATKFRIIANCPDQDAGGTMTVTQLEIVPLDDMQINANYDKNLREMIRKMLIAEGKMNQISAIYDADYTNLWNGELTKFGNPQIDKVGSGYIITTANTNDGAISPQYQSSSVKTLVHVDGSFTTKSVDIQVAYQTPNGQKYMKLGHVEGGTLNNDFFFDAVNLAVYQQASSFRTLIQCNDDNAKGVINITSLEEYELSSFQENPIYDRSMQKMMMNIMTKLDQVSGAVDAIKANKGLYLTNTRGEKVQLILNSDGTVGTHVLGLNNVLFMGNSLLLGLDTNNESGGPFGMCASDSKHDYAYYVEQAILAKNSKAVFSKLHDASFEMAETDDVAQNYIKENDDKFKNQDLVLIQIGDNVGTDIRIKTFKNNLKSLVERVKTDSPAARIVLIGVWYGDNGLSDFIKQVAQDTGCEFIPIFGLNTYDNRAKVGDTITFNNGSTMTVPAKYASHPGDKGHKAIADAILAQLNL